MQARGERELARPGAEVRGLLHDVEAWTDWVPGLAILSRGETVYDGAAERPRRVEVAVLFQAPRDVRMRVSVILRPWGIELSLVEGDLSSLEGELRVEDRREGCRICWDLELSSPLHLPGALVEELRTEVVPRWIDALARG